MKLYAEIFGSGSPVLLLLHGLGVNGAVWRPFVRELNWPGRVIVPDLRGHGRSQHAAHYSLGHHAADVSQLVTAAEVVHVVGHSMGGAIGLVLASGVFGAAVTRVTAFGTKSNWTQEELAKAAKVATAPVRWFDDRDSAVERILLVSGLHGVTADNTAVIEAGIVEEAGRWRLAADPATVQAAGTPLSVLTGVCRAPFRLFCGARDTIVGLDELRVCDPAAFAIDDCGHNPHVEMPERLATFVHQTQPYKPGAWSRVGRG